MPPEKQNNFLYENILSILFETFTLRVWVDQKKDSNSTAKCIPEKLFEQLEYLTYTDNYNYIAEEILETYKQVNAVEVKRDEEGVVVYRDWP